MDYDIYLELIEKELYIEATKYKNTFIPDVLYKYFWLDGNSYKNKQRLSTLERGQIYLSTLDQFNDPFEGKAFVFKEDDAAPRGLRKVDCENFIKQINDRARICCFANPGEKYQNMPMWAYYANNHQGFCVEYQMTTKQKTHIYPVSYDPFRAEGNIFIGNLIMGIVKMIEDGKDSSQMPGEVSVYNHLAYLSLTCKHESWRHEKEYRALVPAENGKFFSAIPSKIYIGMNCSPSNEKALLKIANKFKGCELYKMENDLNDTSFYLNAKRIN